MRQHAAHLEGGEVAGGHCHGHVELVVVSGVSVGGGHQESFHQMRELFFEAVSNDNNQTTIIVNGGQW